MTKAVAGLKHFLSRLGPEQPDPTHAKRAIVRNGAFSEQRLRDRRGNALGESQKVVPRSKGAAAGQDHGPLARIDHVGRAREFVGARDRR
jgi:hypothetical protein